MVLRRVEYLRALIVSFRVIVVGVAIVAMMLMIDFIRANNWIDKCADTSASSFLRDPVERRRQCDEGFHFWFFEWALGDEFENMIEPILPLIKEPPHDLAALHPRPISI